MIIIGIDPGSAVLGYAYLKVNGSQLNDIALINAGDIEFEKNELLEKKFNDVFNFFDEQFKTLKIEDPEIILGIETQFLNKNFHSSVIIAQMRAIFLLLAYRHGITIIQLSPAEIKKTLAGNGHATKEEILFAVKYYFPFLKNISYDCADAIAITLTIFLTKAQ